MNLKIRIAMVISSLGIGGAENVVIQLLNALDRRIYEPKLFVLTAKNENQFVWLLAEKEIPVVFLNLGKKVKLKGLYLFFRTLNAFHPDVVHAHLDVCYSWIWALLYRKKVLFSLHSQPHRIANRKIKFLFSLLNWLNQIQLICVSDQIALEAVRVFKVKPELVTTIYNPIDTKRLLVNRMTYNDHIVFVNVARFHPVKNHELLIRSFANVLRIIPNACLMLAGTGESFDNAKALVQELQIEKSIQFLGNVKDIPKLLARSDVFVLSSDSEAMPITMLEAMAASLPIIATRVGGVPDVIKDNGILVHAKKNTELSQAMITLALNPEKRLRMGKRSRQLAEPFDIQQILKQYDELYRKSIQK